MRTSTPTIAGACGAVAAKKPHGMESQLPTHKAVPEGPITTHMFRNIPRKYTADDIASELQVVSPTSTFDFISLPWDTNKPANLGFAFVNFLDAAGAAMARAAMHGQPWKKARQGAKAIKVCTAHVQGLRENVLYCTDHISPMLSVEHHPIVLFGGRRIDFGDAVRLLGGQSSPWPLELQPSQSQQQEQQQPQQQSTQQSAQEQLLQQQNQLQKQLLKQTQAQAQVKAQVQAKVKAQMKPAKTEKELQQEREQRELKAQLKVQQDELVVKAKELRGKGEIEEAIRVLAEAGELGSGEALNEIGEIYLLREGGMESPSLEVPLRYFTEAADHGFAEAQANIGFLYSTGLLGQLDDAMAVLNYYFASLGGSLRGSMALGYRHLYGYGVPKSCDAASTYYLRVASQVMDDLQNQPLPGLIERVRLSDEVGKSQSPEEDQDVIEYYMHSADNGDVAAQVALGNLFLYGARGVEQSPALALEYFKTAAEQGDASSLSQLGKMYLRGIGVEQNNETALEYFTQAAKEGHSQAQNGLGYMALHGHSGAVNIQVALKNFKAAAEKGLAEAQFNLGEMYFEGNGVERQLATALQYFQKAAQQGHTKAIHRLGIMHLTGVGTVKSCEIGLKLIKTVAERGSWSGVLNTAYRSFLEGSMESAAMQYMRAAEEGYEVAQSNVAWMLNKGLGYEGNSTDMQKLALRSFALASDQGHVDSLRSIGDYHYYGMAGAKPEYAAAAKYYLKAHALGNAQAMFNLGYMHEYGLGLPHDMDLAKRYYDQALEASADAVVPVTLALVSLTFHSIYLEFNHWWEGKEGPISTNSIRYTGAEEEPRDGTDNSFRALRLWLQWLERSMALEDLALLALMAMATVLFWLRSHNNAAARHAHAHANDPNVAVE